MNMPAVGRALVTIHRKYAVDRAGGLLAARRGPAIGGPALPSTPFEKSATSSICAQLHRRTRRGRRTIAQAMGFPIGQMDTALGLSRRPYDVKLVSRRSTICLRQRTEIRFANQDAYTALACGRAAQLSDGNPIAMLAFDREL
jgi:hypothetical protein